MSGDTTRPIRRVGSTWADVILVCRKCSRKLDGGFGPRGDQRFGKALRQALRQAEPAPMAPGGKRRRRSAVIEVGCFDLCPKKAVVVLRADRPGDWLLVPEGAAMTEVVARLGPSSVTLDREP